MWRSDEDHRFSIDREVVRRYFNKTLSLVFDENSARLEEEELLPILDIQKNSSVLDLGCADGRWARLLYPRCRRYVGVDIAERFIAKARSSFPASTCEFHVAAAEDYVSGERFDLILAIGLTTYMNDAAVRKLAANCERQLSESGILLVRSVALQEECCGRRVYDSRPPWFKRVLGCSSYQVIRRSAQEEVGLFAPLKPVRRGSIEGTGYQYYVFRRSDSK